MGQTKPGGYVERSKRKMKKPWRGREGGRTQLETFTRRYGQISKPSDVTTKDVKSVKTRAP